MHCMMLCLSQAWLSLAERVSICRQSPAMSSTVVAPAQIPESTALEAHQQRPAEDNPPAPFLGIDVDGVARCLLPRLEPLRCSPLPARTRAPYQCVTRRTGQDRQARRRTALTIGKSRCHSGSTCGKQGLHCSQPQRVTRPIPLPCRHSSARTPNAGYTANNLQHTACCAATVPTPLIFISAGAPPLTRQGKSLIARAK